MSANPQETQAQAQEAQKQADKEFNFRKQEEGFKRQLDQERQARLQMEQEMQQMKKALATKSQDDDAEPAYDEPYVDEKRLEKKFSKFERDMDEKIDRKAEEKARKLLDQNKQQVWLKSNPDFYEVMQHAEKFAEKDPELAETILEMPEGFERQKLVYKTIKTMGIHKKEEPKANIQETIDKNRRSPSYQPTGVGSAPYGVFNLGREVSPAEGKNAYAKMKELQQKLRLN